MLKDRGVDLISHCHIRVGNGLRTQFWNEVWIGDTQLRVMFPRIYALEINKDCTVADKLQFSVTSSLRRSVRGGVESSQLALLQTYIEGTLLSNMEDRWVWDLNGEGVFRVKDVRILLDECFLPKAPINYGVIGENMLKGTHFRAYSKKSQDNYSDNLYAVSIKEDTAYLCLHFTRNHKELKNYTPYPEDSIRRIEDYLKILEDIKRGPYSKKPLIRCIDLN
ncbi:hypothetical protein Tco_0788643 [Tanacetum coccineum]